MHPSHDNERFVSIPAVTATAPHLQVLAHVHHGPPGLTLTGLPEDAAECTRDRVRAAIINSGFTWPDDPITVRVTPAGPHSADSGLDVAFALAVLAASDQLAAHLVTDTVCVGELGLDGGLRPTREVPARLSRAVRGGFRQAVVPVGNLAEASTFRAVTVRGAYTLRDVVDGLRGDLTAHRRGAAEVLDHLREVRAVRACLSWLVEPGDERLTELLAAHGLFDTLNWIYGHPYDVTLRAEVRRTVPTAQLPGEATRAVEAAERAGAQVVISEDADWPVRLADLAATDLVPATRSADAAPAALCLWVVGRPSLGAVLQRSVTVVGSRAATPYGVHVAADLAHDLTGRGWTVLSSVGYGIDTAALRGALAADGTTVALLPAGVDRPYPLANAVLFDRIADRGSLVSTWPPGTEPTRTRFQANHRVLAALSCGTVVVEAAHRGGALTTLAQAIALGRPAMVVPGPVTSVTSAGCHQALREHREVRAVTTAADIIHDIDAAAAAPN